MSDKKTIYKPLTPALRASINASLNNNMSELNTCENTAYVNIQKTANQMMRNLINSLPDGYLLPFEKS